ncbi:MAG: tripartite tricarboxylate transporter permease [Lachnospiraceae bacterium]|nr:tripartite tricarboxylate transporter permease [Lachnospiraceae bacterium]
MGILLSEWSHLPSVIGEFFSNPILILILLGGLVYGYFIGVVPGLGTTMGMALCLGIIFKMPPVYGLTLLIGILVSSLAAGGITACLANIPGTAAAAATCLDGYPLTLQGKGREAVGYSYVSSIIGTLLAAVFIFLIQPFVTKIALSFGDWEVFLFCIFGLIVCGSLTGGNLVKGWVSAMLGVMVACCGAEGIQSVMRYTFGNPYLLGGVDSTVVLIGLFGLSEVFYILRTEKVVKIEGKGSWPKVDIATFLRNKWNIIRSALAGIWVGFIPGVGEVAACWFSYDIAKRSSKHKEKFGKGSEEGVIAAETANNASTIGALIPALALGVPGSGSAALFIAAMMMIGYRPGPTLLLTSPGILCRITFLFVLGALLMLVVGFVLSRFAIYFLSIPRAILMPFVAVFCLVGAYGTTYTMFGVVLALVFGVVGLFMKIYEYPIAPMVLGILVGKIMDTSFRRAMMQYGANPMDLFRRPLGLAIIALLIVVMFFEIRRTRKSREEKAAEAAAEENK